MVPEDGGARPARAEGGDGGYGTARSGQVQEYLPLLDGKRQGLVHFAPVVVGAADSGLLPARGRLRGGRDARRGAGGGPRKDRQPVALARGPAAGSRCARHVVLVVALADFGLRRHQQPRKRRDQILLSDQRPGDRARHPLLLGGAHDYRRVRIPRRETVRQRLPDRNRARQTAPQDEQVARQLARPDRTDRSLRRRRRARGDAALLGRRQRPAVRRIALRTGTQFRE